MEQIVFPVPNICEYLTEESKVRVFTTTERDDQGSKVNDFFQQFDNLYNEMRWQKKIRSKSQPPSSGWSRWSWPWSVGFVVTPQQRWRSAITLCVCVFPVLFVQKIRLCSGSHVISLFGGASPSTWPVWSTSPWLCSTPLVMMEMRVRIFIFLIPKYICLLN